MTSRAEQERKAAIRRYADALESFLSVWDTAARLAGDPYREVALAALTDYDRERFLTIEKRFRAGLADDGSVA